jgi:2-polyprenyl-6-hydroxyphenyl methylase / 3-demethylubiquinone-9 3-methyltransferase
VAPARSAADLPREPAASVDQAEIRRFAQLAAEWWDPEGKFRPLHALGPVRLAFIRDQAVRRFRRDERARRPLAGLTALDIGCGGGLLAEPLARMGAAVTGIDADAQGIAVARRHAGEGGLAIDYRLAAAEGLVAAGEAYDLVLAMEVVEHVADRAGFLAAAAALTRPGGLLVAATLNRTAKSFALAIVGAEYLLGWLPRGTHDWRKFVRPSELAAGLRRGGLEIVALDGVAYDPGRAHWRITGDLGVNYMMAAVRPGPQ